MGQDERRYGGGRCRTLSDSLSSRSALIISTPANTVATWIARMSLGSGDVNMAGC